MSLAVTPTGSWPSILTAIVLGLAWGKRLGGEDVIDLRRANSEGQRPERLMRRKGVGCRRRLSLAAGQAELRSDDVHRFPLDQDPSRLADPNAEFLCCGRRVSTCVWDTGIMMGRPMLRVR